ncbi:hypothetical protein FOXG_11589 [Fusarium oxysporum f. sp. lycopersici 4287]|uniref:Uncharacterized protein n=1 Tax=Fusarium oxysporum f. sp. lycopersici (strain 4287 / CBS 123668 / FGSC 9935 / NRRL 34936) TaxID=426428 RepID=A0A0J9WR36_FUSO4|nr:hypothetical protein FOXG_11589 [Fusarium oxysporum f. sp. lycopersici 4287]KNB11847.1 hypothetical protein FOXG_11589 [Fusarium oxysporum f. sp. lycopersici 4287]
MSTPSSNAKRQDQINSMDYNFGQDPPSGSGSGSSNWLGFAQRVAVASSSPGVPNTMPEADDASFAESYRPEASPLFNPLFMPRNPAPEGAPSTALSPGPPPSWPWQRDTTFNSDGLESPDVSALPEQPSRYSKSPEDDTPQESATVEEPTDALHITSPERAPFSPLQESAARTQENSIIQSNTTEEGAAEAGVDPEPVVVESRVEIHEYTETIVQSSEKEPEELLSQQELDNVAANGEADRVEETPTQTPIEQAADDNRATDGQQTPGQDQSKSPEIASAPATGPSSLKSALLSVGRGIMKRMSAPPPAVVATPQPDESQNRRATSTQLEQQTERASFTPSLVVELKSMSEPEKATFNSQAPAPEDGPPPAEEPAPASAKRSRRSTQGVVEEASGSATKPTRGRRSIASAPASPVVKNAPSSAQKRTRKSMPASVLADQTPQKRGRPRKSNAVATPAAPPSTAKRGRPRKSDATPITVPSASKPLSARGRRVASASKAVTTPRRATTARTPKTTIGLRAAATPTTTPKPRGRPPKNPPQPTEEEEEVEPEVEAPKRAGRAKRGADSTDDAPATKKSTRTVKPRTVPSPAKRGRATRKLAAALPPAEKAEPVTKRGRRTAAAPKEEAPAEAPKKRGRPATKAEAPAAEESAPEPKTRKRGRAAAVEDTVAEEPVPKRRGRVAKSAPEGKTSTGSQSTWKGSCLKGCRRGRS